jgi:hypothetical protein
MLSQAVVDVASSISGSLELEPLLELFEKASKMLLQADRCKPSPDLQLRRMPSSMHRACISP